MIEYRSIGKTFEDGTEAVGDFSLQLPSRTTTVFVGSSGCGKTTLLRMVNRMVEPRHGQVLIDDVDIVDPQQGRAAAQHRLRDAGGGVAPAPQGHRQRRTDDAAQRASGKKEARERAHDAVLETVGLDSSLANRYPSQLSGGQQQRVGVARGLVTDPNILLMDEPFGAVDPIVREELQAELLRLQRELDKTIVFVTHDIDEAFLLGDQVVILKKGAEVAQVGSPAEILANPANDFVRSFIGLDKGHRKLHVEDKDGIRIVVDETGKATGVLAE